MDSIEELEVRRQRCLTNMRAAAVLTNDPNYEGDRGGAWMGVLQNEIENILAGDALFTGQEITTCGNLAE